MYGYQPQTYGQSFRRRPTIQGSGPGGGGYGTPSLTTSAPGSGPGGLGGRGWEGAGGQEWTPGGFVDPNSWQDQSSYTPPSYEQRLYNAQERDRSGWDSFQQYQHQQDPSRWLEMANQMRQQSPEYWDRWYKPLYGQFGYGSGMGNQMVPSIVGNMFGQG